MRVGMAVRVKYDALDPVSNKRSAFAWRAGYIQDIPVEGWPVTVQFGNGELVDFERSELLVMGWRKW